MPPSIWSNSKSMFLNIWCWYQVVYECVFPSPVSGRRPLDRHCPGRNHLSLNTILLVLVSYHNAMEHLLDKILSWWIWISNGFTGSLDSPFLFHKFTVYFPKQGWGVQRPFGASLKIHAKWRVWASLPNYMRICHHTSWHCAPRSGHGECDG